MPAILVISIPDQPSREVTLERGSYRLGRDADNDLVLESSVVSRGHAKLELRGERWVYTDLNSRNGSFLDGKSVHEVTLDNGMTVQLGRDPRRGVMITLRLSETGSKKEKPKARAVGMETIREKEESTTGLTQLAMIRPQGQEPLLIGRGREADIHLPAPSVSRRHARLEPSAREWVLVDLNSTNGTFVNGQRVRQPRRLEAGDIIQVGSFRLTYEGQGVVKVFAAQHGLRLDGKSMNIIVGQGARRKRILEDVNISCYPQEFIGLVGGSGAGKSTLMKTLSGLLPPQGQVLIEGQDLYHNYDSFRSQIGYVPQDDILHKDLTVQQALWYSAKLRLPPDVGEAEIQQRIHGVLEQVELSAQKDQAINSLSGGQRKRASIAVELLADPPLLFLDEPTSGLDPGLEKKMMVTLRKLADSGKTILLVTHATANITECDQVAFLSQGRLVYYGPPHEAGQFFQVGSDNFAEIYDQISSSEPNQAKARATAWESRFRDSFFYQQYITGRFKTLSISQGKRTRSEVPRMKRARVDPVRQVLFLTRRYFDLFMRDRVLLTILLGIMPLLAILILLIAEPNWLVGDSLEVIEQQLQLKLDEGEKSALYSVASNGQALLLIMSLASVLLGLFSSAYEIVKERNIYARERMVFLGILPYLGSKVVLLSGFAAIQSLLFLVMIGIKLEFPGEDMLIFLPAFLEIYISMLLGAVAAIMLGLLLSALAPNSNAVVYMILGVLFVQILFAGILFEVPGAANYLSKLTLTRWTAEALGISANMEYLDSLTRTRLQPEPVKTDVEVEIAGQTKTQQVTVHPKPKDILTPTKFELNYERSPRHLIGDWGILIGFSLLFGAGTIWVMKRKDVV
jgi:ABC-type multidrug transport system ATPase subunit/pSer/pThr/pTyr-binding forkhead associated (FHA) protein